MHLHHQVPLFLGHVIHHLVAENAGVVDQYIQPAEAVHGGLDDVLAAGYGSHRVIVGYGFPTLLLDFGYHLIRCRRGRAGTGNSSSQVIDYYPGALGCQRQRFTPADAAAGARHHSYFAFQSIAHFICSFLFYFRRVKN